MLANCSQQAVEVLLPTLAEATGAQFWKISSIRMGCTAEKMRGWHSPGMVTVGSAAA